MLSLKKTAPFVWLSLLIFYLPILFIEFAHHDQYRYFAVSGVEKTCMMDTQFKGIFYDLGRPLGALFECLVFKNSSEVFHLVFFRILAVLIIVSVAVLIFQWLKKAVFLSSSYVGYWIVLIFILPGIQYFVITTNIANLTAILLSTLSFLFSIKTSENNIRSYKVFWFSFSWIILLLSLLTYPMSSGFYFVLSGIQVLLIEKKSSRNEIRRFFIHCIFFVSAAVVFLLIIKFYLHPAVNYIPGSGAYGFSLSNDLGRRLFYFLHFYYEAGNLWSIYAQPFIFTFFFAIIIWGFVDSIRRGKGLWEKCFRIVLFFIVPIGVSLPIVLSNFNEFLFRTMIPTSAFLSIYLLLGTCCFLRFFKSQKTRALVIFPAYILILGFSFFSFVMTNLNSYKELSYFREMIKGYTIDKLLVIKNLDKSDAMIGINRLPSVHDEFNVYTTAFSVEEIKFVVNLLLNKKDGRIPIVVCRNECFDVKRKLGNETVVLIKDTRDEYRPSHNVYTIDFKKYILP